MKQILTALLCLLLVGCAPKTDTPSPKAAPETQATEQKYSLYDPNHPMEKAHPSEVRAYPLTLRNVHGIRAWGADVLTLSGNNSTTLTRYTGDDLLEDSSLTVDFSLFQDDPSLQIHGNSISFFDPRQQATLILDQNFREIRRIAAPPSLSGKPILSADADTLYYCTAWAVMAWDLNSGVRRTVKEASYDNLELSALHCQDQILECTVTDGNDVTTLLISSDNGIELEELSGRAQLHAGKAGYFSAIADGYHTLMIFGRYDTAPELLLPQLHPDQQYYLKEDHAVITIASMQSENRLDYYDLDTGILRASLALDKLQTPRSIVSSSDHSLYILTYDPDADCDILYRWDKPQQSANPDNSPIYTSSYCGAESPDTEALAQCREYAQRLGDKYGISVQVWEDACAVQPWDYRFTGEYLAPVLLKELELLDQRLALYPDGVIEKTAAHFEGLTICLVRNITGTPESGSLSSATGIQFFLENHAYVVITTGKYSEQALYHELYHVMDTHVLTRSSALDQWEDFNPADFSYSGSYQPSADTEVYLQGQTQAFVDSYSMSYPKEDRARILEHAMLQGNAELFRSEYMQRKLTALCKGIREAYGLKKLTEVLPWEQYLITPLTPDA